MYLLWIRNAISRQKPEDSWNEIRNPIRPRPNIISRLKVILVKEHTQIKTILIASYFFSEIELATIDIHFSYWTIQLVHKLKAGCDWVIIFGDVYWILPRIMRTNSQKPCYRANLELLPEYLPDYWLLITDYWSLITDYWLLITDSSLTAGDVFFSLKMRLISPILGHTVSVTKHYITQVAFSLLP